METENKDWKPEVGKTAWLKTNHDIKLVKINEHFELSNQFEVQDMTSFWIETSRRLFPTPEAALASIKIYDLDGKEVAIPRAEPAFSLDEMVGFFNKWIRIKGNMKLFFEAQNSRSRTSEAIDEYIQKAKAQIEGGAAIGGKSDQREGGY